MSVSVQPTFPIVDQSVSQAFTLSGAGPTDNITWAAYDYQGSPVPGVFTTSNPGVASVASVAVGTALKIVGTDTTTSESDFTILTVAPSGAMTDKNILIYSTNGDLYLIATQSNSAPGATYLVGSGFTGVTFPQYIINNDGGTFPGGSGGPPTFQPPPPSPTSGITYVTCVVVNLASSNMYTGVVVRGRE
jgi:hypothetical protein